MAEIGLFVLIHAVAAQKSVNGILALNVLQELYFLVAGGEAPNQ